MKPALLDINVLIALIDPQHQFHAEAHVWFKRNRRHGWATCPLTQNGCLRILGKPAYPFTGITTNTVRNILVELTALEGHCFWPDSISVLELSRFDLRLANPKHLTDIYLLGLAHSYSGRLATFDRTIRWQAVPGCSPSDLEILGEPV